MSGRIKSMIDTIIEKKSGGNLALASSTKIKMIMKGIFPEKYTEASQDDPTTIEKLMSLAKELNINI